MSSERGKLRFPLVLRTRDQHDAAGTAPWKAAYARHWEQLRTLAEQVEGVAGNVLAQEYHAGAEDHVQILMHDGQPFMVGEYIGEHHMPLAGGVTVQRITCRHEPVIRDGVRLLKALHWEGIAGVQFHYDRRTHRYIFLEINPRFIGGLPTVVMAGFDAPFLLWQSHFEPHRMRASRYRLGMRTRVSGGDANWMLGMIRGDELPPGQKRLSKLAALGEFLMNFGPWTRDDVFELGDLKPFFVDWRKMVGRLGDRTVDIVGNPQTPRVPQ
jgi:predicted ATP-grasp superfamily ATP-dependent carboligase